MTVVTGTDPAAIATAVDWKQIVKEEVKISLDNLKAKGKEISKEALEIMALEISDMVGRIALRTENKMDDFYLMVKGMVDEELGKISDK